MEIWDLNHKRNRRWNCRCHPESVKHRFTRKLSEKGHRIREICVENWSENLRKSHIPNHFLRLNWCFVESGWYNMKAFTFISCHPRSVKHWFVKYRVRENGMEVGNLSKRLSKYNIPNHFLHLNRCFVESGRHDIKDFTFISCHSKSLNRNNGLEFEEFWGRNCQNKISRLSPHAWIDALPTPNGTTWKHFPTNTAIKSQQSNIPTSKNHKILQTNQNILIKNSIKFSNYNIPTHSLHSNHRSTVSGWHDMKVNPPSRVSKSAVHAINGCGIGWKYGVWELVKAHY